MKNKKTQVDILGIGLLVIVVVVLGWAFLAVKIVPAGHQGVPTVWQAVQGYTVSPGLHIVTPIVENIVSIEVRTQVHSADAESASKDLQEVHTKVALNFHLLSEKVSEIYQNVGMEYERRVIDPAIQESVKAATAQFNAEELITHRPLVKEAIKADISDRLLPYGIYVETVSIVNFDFSAEFNKAIEAKVVAQQARLEAEINLETIKIEAQQMIEKSKGEAESIRIINEQLLKSPQYIEYIAVEKWDGVMPLATSGALPFIGIGE